MLIHCWMCNGTVTLPPGPACRVNARRDSSCTRLYYTGLCKALEVAPEDFVEDLDTHFSCETCSKTVEQIWEVVSTLEKLQNTLTRLREDVRRSLVIASGVLRHSEDQLDDDGNGEETNNPMVKFEFPEYYGADDEDVLREEQEVEDYVPQDRTENTYRFDESRTYLNQDAKLNALRRRIIKCMNQDSVLPVQQDNRLKRHWTMIYPDLEKEKKLQIKLARLDEEIKEKYRIAAVDAGSFSGDDSAETCSSVLPVYMDSSSNLDEDSAPPRVLGLRKSSRKRKPTVKMIKPVTEELSDDETNVVKARDTESEEEGYDWKYPSEEPFPEDEEDDDYEENASGHPIRLLQFKGRKNRENSVYCEKCNRNYGSKFDLETHMKKRHQGIYRPYSCDIEGCGKAFRLRSSWLHHKEFHTKGGDAPEKRFVCKECGKGYDTNNSLQRHVSVHTGKWKYPCTQEGCTKGFHRPSELRAHIRIHENLLEFKCNFCEEKFATKRKRVFHESSIHTDEVLDKSTMCEYCLKVFSSIDALRCHKIQVHSEESKFRCEDCGHGFAKLSWLNRHKLQHSEEKTFNCEYCDEKFRFPNSLAAHKMKHEGKYPHVCSTCDKKFTLLHQLKIHQLIHSKEKSYVCEYCGKTFSIHTYLRHHVKRMHFKELGMTELPLYYIKEKNRKKTKKPSKITDAGSVETMCELGNAPPDQIKQKRKKKSNKPHVSTHEDQSKEIECHNLLSGMNVGDEALIITDANGSTNVEVEFLNVGVLEYVVHTSEAYESQEEQKSDDVEEVTIQQVEVHELETQKIETDPFIEFIVTQANN